MFYLGRKLLKIEGRKGFEFMLDSGPVMVFPHSRELQRFILLLRYNHTKKGR